ncbi:phage virion morphogenesis protein [Azorhizobium caulinodans]|uniref:phage virion morphogenesis protein n=1 Tax=Azorhizobium caulinodans TaxID=7 RepID=UPI002FBE412E
MSGATLETRVVGTAAIRAFQRLSLVMANTTPVMRAIGTGLIEGTHTRFEKAVDPDGTAWAPLNPAYEAIKKGPGILRESAMRGGLMGSITQRATHNTVEVGTNKIHAAVHQFGATITPQNAPHLRFRMGAGFVQTNSVTIPARPFLGVSAEDGRMIEEVMVDALDRAVGPQR